MIQTAPLVRVARRFAATGDVIAVADRRLKINSWLETTISAIAAPWLRHLNRSSRANVSHERVHLLGEHRRLFRQPTRRVQHMTGRRPRACR